MGEHAQLERRDAMVCAMARSVPEDSLCIQGLMTPLATVAMALASELRPGIVSFLTDGGTFTLDAPPIFLRGTSSVVGMARFRFAELICEIVPTHQPFEFMRPAQLDRFGNSNNVCIGRGANSLRLPGPGGIPEATTVNSRLSYYLPRHDTRTLVAEVDFVSGAGRSSHPSLPRVPTMVFTELCTLAFHGETLAVVSMHRGVRPEEVIERTGWALACLEDADVTAPPSTEERNILDRLDPMGLRYLEFMSSRERSAAIDTLIDL